MSLTRDDILKADDLKKETVHVPEWGGDVIISTMTGAGRDLFELEVYGEDGKQFKTTNLRAKLIAATAQDEDGNLLFNEEDVDALGRKSGAALNRCFSVAMRLNGMGKKDIEKLEKNLSKGQPADSISN